MTDTSRLEGWEMMRDLARDLLALVPREDRRRQMSAIRPRDTYADVEGIAWADAGTALTIAEHYRALRDEESRSSVEFDLGEYRVGVELVVPAEVTFQAAAAAALEFDSALARGASAEQFATWGFPPAAHGCRSLPDVAGVSYLATWQVLTRWMRELLHGPGVLGSPLSASPELDTLACLVRDAAELAPDAPVGPAQWSELAGTVIEHSDLVAVSRLVSAERAAPASAPASAPAPAMRVHAPRPTPSGVTR